VESELGKGSRFWFTACFGVWQSEETAPPAPAPLVEAAPARLRILVAEDNRVNQLVALRLLTRDGHECVLAENGAEALRVIESQQIDVVLMDVHMPVMDGHAATREIRRREEGTGRHVPIIAVTASATTDVVEACQASGMNHYLSKPLLIEAVREILQGITPGEPPSDGGSST
jgi:two-component system sensor histidine kinase/response regulator